MTEHGATEHTGAGHTDTESAGPRFIDYYEFMQISPNAQAETIQRVYRILAGRSHPDNPHTGDLERFLRLKEAFEVLNHPERRAAYDEEYRIQQSLPGSTESRTGAWVYSVCFITAAGSIRKNLGCLCSSSKT